MAVGQGAIIGALSYIAVGRELTYGTYVTGVAGLSFNSASMKTMKETKILEEVQASRTNSNYLQTSRTIEGDIEFQFNAKNLACNYLLHNAFCYDTIASVTATGETLGGAGITHTIDIGNYGGSYGSLSINMRKGNSGTGQIFEYNGLRVNELSFKATIDEPLIASVSLIGKDVSTTANDVASKIADTTTSLQSPLSFVNGRVSIESGATGTGNLTTTSFWHVIAMDFKIANNLNSDANARRIGTDTLQVLPPGLAQFDFKVTIRFDTTTAFAGMLAGTRMSGEFEFLGDTLASNSAVREGLKITMPYLIVSDAGDPDVGGPNDPLTSEVTFAVLRDPTASGYAVRAKVTNLTQNYT